MRFDVAALAGQAEDAGHLVELPGAVDGLAIEGLAEVGPLGALQLDGDAGEDLLRGQLGPALAQGRGTRPAT